MEIGGFGIYSALSEISGGLLLILNVCGDWSDAAVVAEGLVKVCVWSKGYLSTGWRRYCFEAWYTALFRESRGSLRRAIGWTGRRLCADDGWNGILSCVSFWSSSVLAMAPSVGRGMGSGTVSGAFTGVSSVMTTS